MIKEFISAIIGNSDERIKPSFHIDVESENEIQQLFANVVILQLIALETALKLKRNVDSPKGLHKVVVEKNPIMNLINQFTKFKPLQMFKDKTFLGIWLMFFINIHCGLALITYEKQILKVAFAGTAILGTMISIIPSVTAAFNALGRIGYSTISDKMKERNTVSPRE